VRSLTRIRFVAIVLAGFLIAPAIVECALLSANGSHACCANRGALAPETTMTACCGMSQQANDAVPPNPQPAGPSLKLLSTAVTSYVGMDVRMRIPSDAFAARPAAVVPLYLRQASLLI
jgi:hypothetical protein